MPVSFAKVINLWLRLELQATDNTVRPPLLVTKRPAWVTYWIARACGREEDLSGKKSSTLAKDFWTWWILMQPAWRNVKASDAPLYQPARPVDVGDQSWGTLDTRGVNGFLSVLMVLGWWGEIAMENILDLGTWDQACLDVSWVLSFLCR